MTRSHKIKIQGTIAFSFYNKFSTYLDVRFLYLTKKASHVLAGETAADFTPIFYMLGFGLLASVPALISHFMMQYYAYILMFVVFDVMTIFLYAWGTALFNIPRAATLPIIGFLAIMFAAMGYALYLSGRKGIW
jgi:NADH-quinone oxidoreductase subunit A